MEKAVAKTKYVRISPRKARLVAGLIRKLPVTEAIHQLSNTPQKAAPLLKKTLLSAIANFEVLHDVRREEMVVGEVRVDGGPIIKRAKPRNKGGRSPINKRTSHFQITIEKGRGE
ncbi:MAG: 50S ribosomal protein L22 [Chlamydiae bacterium]|nr:50S ribosomal protein L22 [Chlamydiota bacterium]